MTREIRLLLARRELCALRAKVREMVDDMLRPGVIQPSSSPWASPIAMVKKKDGTFRFCVDYRRENAVTRPDIFPLPRVDDLLDQLGGGKVFNCLDAASGYWQVPLSPASRQGQSYILGSYHFSQGH